MKRREKSIKARWWQVAGYILGVALKKWSNWRVRRRTLHQLRRLNDEQLKDIGLTSHDVERFR